LGLACGILVYWLCSPSPACPSEIAVHYPAIGRILARQVFTQDGRKYLSGAPVSRCRFAYLENPRVSGENGVLNVRARFTGRSALDVFGKCVGLGDSFDALIAASPYDLDGAIRLKDVRVEGQGKDGFYVRRVCAPLARTLRSEFAYGISEDARALFEHTREGASHTQRLVRFSVPSIRVSPDAVILTVDFSVAVK
jgi:hypothetical protein